MLRESPAAFGKEAPERQHGRGLAIVVCADKKRGLIGQVDPHRK
jgi:hypothetical protein